MVKMFTLAWKDALVRFAYRSELLFFIILPVVFTTLLAGVAVPGGGPSALPLLLADADASALSAELVAALQSSPTIDAELLSPVEAQAAFAAGDASALLLIPAGFERDLLAGQPLTLDLQTAANDLNGPLLAQTAAQVATAVTRPLQAAHQAARQQELVEPFASEAARQAYFRQALAAARALDAATPAKLVVAAPPGAAPPEDEQRPQQQAAGQMVGWVLIPLLGIATFLAYERQRGTLRRLAATPTSSATYFLGTIGGQVVTAGVQIAILIGFGALALGLDWGRSPAGLVAVLFAFCLCGAALGTALGAFVHSPGQARSLAIILGMGMSLLGGAWVPIEVYPAAVRTAVQVLPTFWAMQGLLDIIIRGQGLRDVLPETAVLLGFATLFFLVGVRRFRFA